MSCNSRICEPCKVSEVLAGACLVGRPASALGALLGFNTHLDGPHRRLSDHELVWSALPLLFSPGSSLRMGGPGLVLTFDYGSFSSSCRVVWLTSSSRVDSAMCGSSIHHAQKLWSRNAPVDFFSSLLGKWEGHSTPFRAPYRLRWSCSRFSRSALCT